MPIWSHDLFGVGAVLLTGATQLKPNGDGALREGHNIKHYWNYLRSTLSTREGRFGREPRSFAGKRGFLDAAGVGRSKFSSDRLNAGRFPQM
jgi:hypothetical protein